MSTKVSKAVKEEKTAAPSPIEIYHVTNVSAEEEPPQWQEIMTSIADDVTYDGVMVGLPVACFTSTRSNFTKGKPNKSMYPRDGEISVKYYRVTKNVYLSDYNIFFLGAEDQQRHLLFLRKGDQIEEAVNDVLVKCGFQRLTAADHWTVKYDKKKEIFFPEGGVNEYHGQKVDTFWVNTNFWSSVDIRGGNWDKVPRKNTPGQGMRETSVRNHLTSLARLNWLMKQVSRVDNFEPSNEFLWLVAQLTFSSYEEEAQHRNVNDILSASVEKVAIADDNVKEGF